MAVGAGGPYSPCYHIGLCFVFGRNKFWSVFSFWAVILFDGLLQAEAMEHFAGDSDHGNHEF